MELTKNKMVLYVVIIIAFGIVLRVYITFSNQNSIQSSYSTHAKTALNYRWILEDLAEKPCASYEGQELFDRFYKLAPTKFNYDKLYLELEKSNHPPLYYVIIHYLQSLQNDGRPAYLQAYVLNIVFSVITMFFFLLVAKKLLKNDCSALVALFVYALNLGIVSIDLYHKSYELQMTLSLVTVYFLMKQLDRNRIMMFDYILMIILCLTLFLSHYIAIFFIVMLGTYLLINDWYKEQWYIRTISFAGCAVIALIILIILVPFSAKDIFIHGKTSGSSIGIIGKDSLFSFSDLLISIVALFKYIITWPFLMMITFYFFPL